MKKKISYILTLLVLVVFASSCYDDKGNYDYVEISKVTTTSLEAIPRLLFKTCCT